MNRLALRTDGPDKSTDGVDRAFCKCTECPAYDCMVLGSDQSVDFGTSLQSYSAFPIDAFISDIIKNPSALKGLPVVESDRNIKVAGSCCEVDPDRMFVLRKGVE